MSGTPLEEMELVERAKAGDAACFASLVRLYQDRVYSVAYRVLASAEDAADTAQETFLAAWEGLARFRGDSSLYTWLYRIAVNKALARRRSRASKGRFVAGSADGSLDGVADFADGPQVAVERAENARIVQAAISALPEDLRVIVVLRDIEGLEYEEIAEVLEIPLGTVKSRLHRGRLDLRESLKGVFRVAP